VRLFSTSRLATRKGVSQSSFRVDGRGHRTIGRGLPPHPRHAIAGPVRGGINTQAVEANVLRDSQVLRPVGTGLVQNQDGELRNETFFETLFLLAFKPPISYQS
jgi:hypothetical protein